MHGDFVENLGLPFLAHRLRRVSDTIIHGAGAVFRGHGIALPPRGGSLVMLLAEAGTLSITDVAKRLRLSHPLIITLSRTLGEAGLLLTLTDPKDKRRRLVSLTKKGQGLAVVLRDVNRALARTYRGMFDEAGIDLFAAVEAFEAVANDRSFEQRFREHLLKGRSVAKKPK